MKVITVHHRIYNVGQFTFQGDLLQEYKFAFKKSKGQYHYHLLNPGSDVLALVKNKHLKQISDVELDHKDLVYWMRDLREAVALEKEVLYDSLHVIVKSYNKQQLIQMLEVIKPNVYIEKHYKRAELLHLVLDHDREWYKIKGIKGIDPRTFKK